jgi:long-chain acyl-CoA synthetase
MTINEMFQTTVANHGAKVALRYKKDKTFHDISYDDLADRVATLCAGLIALGIEKGDRVALLSENRPEWAVTDLAVLALGGVVVPLYPTLPAPQIAYIVRNSGAKALIVSDKKQLAKAVEARKEFPALSSLIVMDDAPGRDESVLTFDSVRERGAAEPLADAAYAARWKAATPDDVASLVYTSGTTGDPKGAMLTHGNFFADIEGSRKHYGNSDSPVTCDDTFLSFLPMCHAYERTTGYYLPIRVGATVGYCEGVRTLMDDMAQVRPTLMVCVPRVYEAMQERIQDTVAKAPEKRQKLFRDAIARGEEYAAAKISGKSPGPILSLKHIIFDKLVYGKLRERFGGRFRFFVSGGAALSTETARFFLAIGIPISEGYGMTEASPVMSTNPVSRTKVGTVGTVITGGEFKIAEDGEILYRGANVMKGYWQNPVATAEVIDAAGWLHTGDIGALDGDGYLKITDRKKDILVLANGKNVAPQPIEQTVKQSPYISEIVLIGDRQSIVTALVLPNKSKLGDWAKEQGLAFNSDAELLALPEVRKKIKAEIDARSGALADFERIKKFTLLDAAFSVESGEMTPTLKIKRKVVLQKYAREIAEMRGGDAADVAS